MKEHKCELCNAVFYRKDHLTQHLNKARKCNIVTDFSCEWCNKSFTSNSHLKRHIIACKVKKNYEQLEMKEKEKADELKKILIGAKVTDASSIKCEYVYLLQEREFINSGQSVYKIGRTKQLNDKRFKQYPKNSMLLLQTICNNCTICENQIMNTFKQKYIHRVDIGSEYFEGDFKEMQRDIFNIVMNENETKV